MALAILEDMGIGTEITETIQTEANSGFKEAKGEPRQSNRISSLYD